MTADRTLDATVAREILGFTTWRAERPEYVAGRDWVDPGDYFYYPDGTSAQAHRLPDYSTDISAAWIVVGEMERRGYWCETRTPFMAPFGDDGYWAGFTPHATSGWNGTPDHWTSSEAMPLSICLAALAARGVATQ